MPARDETGPEEGILAQSHINLNKTQLVTRDWERVYEMLGDHLFAHIYKEYLIFFKTKDDALIQVSGTNIFSYLSEKFGRSAVYEQPGAESAAAAGVMLDSDGKPVLTVD